MKLCWSFLLGVFVFFNCSAQSNVYDVKNYMSLTEEVHLIRVFIDTEYGVWEEDEILAYDQKLTNSLSWLSEEANVYGADVQFNLSTFEHLEKLVDLSVGSYRNTRGLRDQVIRELGFNNVDHLLSRNGFDMDNNKLKLIVLVKSNNRSHARNYWSVKGLDIAVVYCNNTIGMATTSYVMAHELLHLFGAWDLYKGEWQSAEKAAELLTKYPHSIMINTWRNQELLEVDELTAWRVGWGNYDKAFMEYTPVRQRPESKGNTAIEFKLGKKKKG